MTMDTEIKSATPKMGWRLLLAVAGLALVSACASVPTDPAQKAAYDERQDPAEPFNRAMFSFNDTLDKNVMKPVATVYRDYTPAFSQKVVHNFLNNLKSPVILTNDLLQGEWDRASDTAARFLINSTIGVLGIGDVAGIERHGEDMGQTFATYGAGEGAYLVLPFMGPTTIRDTAGDVVDRAFDPLTYVGYGDWSAAPYIGPVRTGMGILDLRSRNITTLDDIERTSIDYYATIRSLYRQRRSDEIRNGTGSPDVPAPDISYEEEELGAPETSSLTGNKSGS